MSAPGEYDAKRQAVHARRAEAVRLKLVKGWSPTEIGLHLHADPAHNTRGHAVREGYGADRYRAGEPALDGARLAQAVARDIARALRKQATRYDDDTEALRRLRIAQYEVILRAAMDDAKLDDEDDPDTWESPEDRQRAAEHRFKAREQAIRVLGRLDEVQGTKRPTRTEITGADGAPLIDLESVDDLRKLIAANAAADQQEGPAGG
ncbi:hypothetical protein OG618_37230 (plasmid) [Kitasatospora sp. NBC_01246]|uniref:hypothetical protein n=1 Tax=Kitasatospora sp. NBC_01246 TaxID=2903570 RepID=UPI002E3556C0|nr:hypothetical protein [Kitasatospora sp. NBC_01246]